MLFPPPKQRTPALIAIALLMVLIPASLPAHPKKGKEAGAEDSPSPAPKPLAEVVKGHEKLTGLVTLYRNPEHLYAEIPDSLVGQPLGLAGILVKALGDWSVRGGGLESQVVSFSKAGDRIILAKRNIDYRADPSSSFRAAVDDTFPNSPAYAAKVVPVSGGGKTSLVDLAGLFSPDLMPALPHSAGYSANPEDAAIASVHDNPDNLVVRVVYRFKRREPGESDDEEENPAPAGFRRRVTSRLPDSRYLEATVDYNLFRLPEDGYRSRRADERIGGFDSGYKDYTGVGGRDTAFRYIFARWNLEKTDPGASVSPAKEPITFYVDKATPPEWRPRVKEAALWWNRSFEKIGIRDAVRVLDQPEDPAWDPTDIHHSMIYWNLSDNLMFSGLAGAQVEDPRTGQILKANAYLNGEFPSYTLHRYLVYAWWRAPQWERMEDPFQLPASESVDLGERARRLEDGLPGMPRGCDYSASFSSQIAFARLVLRSRGVLGKSPEESERFAREAFAELVAHEVGHALGFSHNFKASLIAPAADVTGGKVTGHPEDHPFTGSIMDYDPIYLSERGKPQGDYFMRGVGPYDDLMLEYIYRPFPLLSPEEESKELDRIAKKAETTPGLMFDDGSLSEIDPSSSTDDLGDDPLAFAESRLAMIQEEVLPRIADLVVEEGHDYNKIRQALDAAVFSVALDYIDMAARHVGGQSVRRIVAAGAVNSLAPPVAPLDPAIQRRALNVLDRKLFDPSAFPGSPRLLSLLKSDYLYDWNYPWRYYTDYSFESRIAFLYDSALSALFQPRRLARVLDNERRGAPGASPLTLPELFGHLESTAFEGLDKAGLSPASDKSPAIPARRRGLQRLYVTRLSGMILEPAPALPPEAGQVARGTLLEIRTRLRRITGTASRLAALDGYSRAHLLDLDAVITRALEARAEIKPRA